MSENFSSDTTLPEATEDSGELAEAVSPAIESASNEYLGRWNRLVSTTNWEKGRIVAEWREALIEAGAPMAAYTDEAWSRRVGSVTPQHTGRLRRVYQRFAASREAYAGLYWSHFQAALDWEDAEMWLEGASQNSWSISQMQGKRASTLGALVEEHVEAAAVEFDEDAATPANSTPTADASQASTPDAAYETDDSVSGSIEPSDDRPSFDSADSSQDSHFAEEPAAVRPFENLPSLPADLRDAFDGFKVAIVRHRLAHWEEVSLDDVLATLESLRQLALAPA